MRAVHGRGSHSSTVQLNLIRFSHKVYSKPPDTSYTPREQPLNAPPIPHKAPTLSRKVNEFTPLVHGRGRQGGVLRERAVDGDGARRQEVVGRVVCCHRGRAVQVDSFKARVESANAFSA